MPATPFHYPLAYLIYKLDRKLSLPALVVGSMFPDLEIPVIVLLFTNRIPSHLVLHSLLGAATIGTILSVIFTVLFYPFLISTLFGVERRRTKRKCRLSLPLVFSAFLGNMSHVLLDVTVHIDNAILWPFINNTPSPVVSTLGIQSASLLIHIIMGIIFLVLLYSKRQNLVESLLVE